MPCFLYGPGGCATTTSSRLIRSIKAGFYYRIIRSVACIHQYVLPLRCLNKYGISLSHINKGYSQFFRIFRLKQAQEFVILSIPVWELIRVPVSLPVPTPVHYPVRYMTMEKIGMGAFPVQLRCARAWFSYADVSARSQVVFRRNGKTG